MLITIQVINIKALIVIISRVSPTSADFFLFAVSMNLSKCIF